MRPAAKMCLLLSAQRRGDMTESLPPELTVTRCFASADVRTAWLDHSTNLHLYILMLGRKNPLTPTNIWLLNRKSEVFLPLETNQKKKKDQSKRDQKEKKKKKNKPGAATAPDKASALAVSHCFLVDGTSDFQESGIRAVEKQSDSKSNFILRLHPLMNKHTILNQSGVGRSKAL